MRIEPAGNAALELEGAHWSFATDFYGRPGVSEACLMLQDGIGADVSLLLFVLFLAREQRAILDPVDLEELDGAIADWRREVVWPLRSIRRRMKSGPYPAPHPASRHLLEEIKAAEIHAEQIELAAAARWFQSRPRAISASSIDIGAVLDGLVGFFALRCGAPEARHRPEVRAALKALADAI